MHRIAFICWLLVASCLAPLPTFAQQRPAGGAPGRLLHDLVNTSGVSGFETDVRELIRVGLQGLSAAANIRTDDAGNLIVTIGAGAPHVLVCANMDEDGYFVSGITDDGYLRLHRVTTGVTNRLFEQMHYGQPIVIRTQGGKPAAASASTHVLPSTVAGVITTASTHLQRGRDQAPAPKSLDDLWVDVGAQNRGDVERLGIQMLDPISLREREQPLTGERVAGVAAQGRAIDVALADFLWRLDPKSVTGTLTIAWTVRGSFGDRGMARLAQEITPDRIIVVTRTAMPRDGNNPKGAVGQLGGGVLVADSDTKTIELAKQQGMAVQAVAGVLRAPTVAGCENPGVQPARAVCADARRNRGCAGSLQPRPPPLRCHGTAGARTDDATQRHRQHPGPR